ncbi:hypothetical protein [Tabrizicola sp.]|nr:hypothetical protein [Tabrizicola sp.]MDP3194406.1 hypothetical protein [Tabrizicola sp.]
MAINLKKMSFGQLVGIAAAVFVVVMVIAGALISASGKPEKAVRSRPAQFESPVNGVSVELEQLRLEVKALREKVDSNAQSAQAAFSQMASAVDQQNKNLTTLDNNIQVTASRVGNLEKARIGTRINVVKPEEQDSRPTRSERIAAAERSAERRASKDKSMQLTGGDSKVLASVGNRAWIRNGNDEWSVSEGETIPLDGALVIKRVAPNGQVLVDVQAKR